MSEQEMMEAWLKTATPGTEHQLLARYSGEWQLSMKSWMDPTAPAAEYEGTAMLETILGGRVRTEKTASEMMGMPFEGFGMIGFDNRTQQFWLTWNDNMSTNCWFVTGGSLSADKKTITFHAEMPQPDGTTKNKVRMVYRLQSEDYFIFEHFETAAGSAERKTMEMHYRRK